jgi:DNA repair protein RadC
MVARGSAKFRGTAALSSSDAVEFFSAYTNERQEHFLAATLTAKHRVIKIHVVSIGTVSRTVVAPREVFYPAIVDNAVAVIVAHNHPGGCSEPGTEDDDVTVSLAAAGKLLGIQVLDHIIVAKEGYYSYRKNGRMEGPEWESALEEELNTLKTPLSSTS